MRRLLLALPLVLLLSAPLAVADEGTVDDDFEPIGLDVDDPTAAYEPEIQEPDEEDLEVEDPEEVEAKETGDLKSKDVFSSGLTDILDDLDRDTSQNDAEVAEEEAIEIHKEGDKNAEAIAKKKAAEAQRLLKEKQEKARKLAAAKLKAKNRSEDEMREARERALTRHLYEMLRKEASFDHDVLTWGHNIMQMSYSALRNRWAEHFASLFGGRRGVESPACPLGYMGRTCRTNVAHTYTNEGCRCPVDTASLQETGTLPLTALLDESRSSLLQARLQKAKEQATTIKLEAKKARATNQKDSNGKPLAKKLKINGDKSSIQSSKIHERPPSSLFRDHRVEENRVNPQNDLVNGAAHIKKLFHVILQQRRQRYGLCVCTPTAAQVAHMLSMANRATHAALHAPDGDAARRALWLRHLAHHAQQWRVHHLPIVVKSASACMHALHTVRSYTRAEHGALKIRCSRLCSKEMASAEMALQKASKAQAAHNSTSPDAKHVAFLKKQLASARALEKKTAAIGNRELDVVMALRHEITRRKLGLEGKKDPSTQEDRDKDKALINEAMKTSHAVRLIIEALASKKHSSEEQLSALSHRLVGMEHKIEARLNASNQKVKKLVVLLERVQAKEEKHAEVADKLALAVKHAREKLKSIESPCDAL